MNETTYTKVVTSYAEVWIEIMQSQAEYRVQPVTSYAEVWIEMMVIILY